jgi:hypothetical protein
VCARVLLFLDIAMEGYRRPRNASMAMLVSGRCKNVHAGAGLKENFQRLTWHTG